MSIHPRVIVAAYLVTSLLLFAAATIIAFSVGCLP